MLPTVKRSVSELNIGTVPVFPHKGVCFKAHPQKSRKGFVLPTIFSKIFNKIFSKIFSKIFTKIFNKIFNEIFNEIFDKIFNNIFNNIFID